LLSDGNTTELNQHDNINSIDNLTKSVRNPLILSKSPSSMESSYSNRAHANFSNRTLNLTKALVNQLLDERDSGENVASLITGKTKVE